MEKGWEKTKQKQQNQILDFYIQRERSTIKIIFGIPFFWFGFFFLVMGSFKQLLILIFAGIAGGWVLHYICGSYFSIACSHVGKELCKYGRLKEVKRDVEEQAKRALYCSGDQAITEKYLILLLSVSGCSRFWKGKERLCLISTRELEQILITDCLDGESEEKKGYTMCFLTWQKERFCLTVWGTYEEVCQIQKKLEECRDLGIGPEPARSQNKYQQIKRKEDRSLKEDVISDRQQVLNGHQWHLFQKGTVFTQKRNVIQECYRKKRRLCIIIYFGILGIFLIVIGLVIWVEWDSFQCLFQSTYWNLSLIHI